MKTQLKNFIIVLIIATSCHSCSEEKSHYDQIVKVKAEQEYINSINQSFEEIRKKENNDFLIKEEFDLLRYEYELGDKEDTYQVTYRFDRKGCFEVGLDAYIERVEEANIVVAGFKKYFDNNDNFKEPVNDNTTFRWETQNELLVTELDYSNAARGRVALTIFSYE